MGQTVRIYLNGASEYTAYVNGLVITVAELGSDGIERGAYHVVSETPQASAETTTGPDTRPVLTKPDLGWDAEEDIDPADRV